MIDFGLFVFTICTSTAGLMGHQPVLGRLAHRALTHRRAHGRPTPRPPRPVPSWAHTEPYDYDATA